VASAIPLGVRGMPRRRRVVVKERVEECGAGAATRVGCSSERRTEHAGYVKEAGPGPRLGITRAGEVGEDVHGGEDAEGVATAGAGEGKSVKGAAFADGTGRTARALASACPIRGLGAAPDAGARGQSGR